MIRGLWVSAGALSPVARAQEILANNLANAATGGFRQDRVVFQRVAAQAAGGSQAAGGGQAATGAPTAGGAQASPEDGLGLAPQLRSRLDASPGAFETTESPYHLAVSGPGYLTVQGPQGELYTRDGTLQRAADGALLHRSGYPLLTEGGTITVPASAQFTVSSDGMVFVDGEARGKLRLAALTDASGIHHAGSGLVSSTSAPEADTTSRILQGSLEGSNVDPVLSMVDMVMLLREFESNQRAILTQDGSLGRLIQWAAG